MLMLLALCNPPPPPHSIRATSGPIVPASWRVPDWYFDEANSAGCAADTNSCTSATCVGGCSGSICPSANGPCATWNEVVFHRLGTDRPYLQQVTTFHQLSAQPLNVHPIFFFPSLPPSTQANLVGSLTPVCTMASGTTSVTPQVRGSPGTRWQVSPLCVGASPKMLLQDTSQPAGGSWATIDSVAGSIATVSQPLPNAMLTVPFIPSAGSSAMVEATMVSGDGFTVWAQPLSNVKMWRPRGDDDDGNGGIGTLGWVQFVEVADSTGVGGSPAFIANEATSTVFSGVRFDTKPDVSSLGGRGSFVDLLGCDVSGQLNHIFGLAYYYGGVFRSGAQVLGGGPVFGGDAVLHGSVNAASGLPSLGGTLTDAVFADGSLLVLGASVRQNGIVWGSLGITVFPAATYWNANGGAWASTLLTSGALKLGTATTGSKYAAGTFTDGINISPSNLDANGPLQNPATGARFSNTQ